MPDWLSVALGCGVTVAIVNGVFKLLEKKVEHRSVENAAKLKAAEALIGQNKANVAALIAAGMVIIRINIKETVQRCLEAGTVSYDVREDVTQMYRIYQEELGGNGNLGSLMDTFLGLPIVGFEKGEGQ